MKKTAILAFVFLLAGCGPQYPIATHLKLRIDSLAFGVYSDDSTAALTGHDARQDSSVVVYRLQGKPEIQIPNQTAPHIVVTEQLAEGLQQQGLVFANGSPVHIQLDLYELDATVTRPKLLYSTRAKSRLTLTVKNREFSLKKTYDRETNRDSATRPPVEDLENMLNEQLTEIVNQILQDEEIRAAITQQKS
ncbi:MAG: YajG family lipoprotein [Desulforhopalus sp.]